MSQITVVLELGAAGNLKGNVDSLERVRDHLKEIEVIQGSLAESAGKAGKAQSYYASEAERAKRAALAVEKQLAAQQARSAREAERAATARIRDAGRLLEAQRKAEAAAKKREAQLRIENSLLGQLNGRIAQQKKIIAEAMDVRTIRRANQELEKLQQSYRRIAQAGKESSNTFGNALGSFQFKFNFLGNLVSDLALRGTQELQDMAGRVISITAEFKKLQAVLSNALQSDFLGKLAFQQIVEFAAKTNFSVRELSELFVKLANRGVKPTTDQMQAMADVANSLGKPMEQLGEAILDINNSERWTELGLKVKKAGDQLTTTFRGVTVSAEATEKGALELVTAIGKIPGVAGSTEAVAKELGGSLSNLDDAYDRLFNTIGDGVAVDGANFIRFLTAAIDGVERFLRGREQVLIDRGLKDMAGDAENFSKAIQQLVQDYISLGESREEAERKAKGFFDQDARDQMQEFSKELRKVDAEISRITERMKFNTQTGAAALSNANGPLLDQLATLKEQRLILGNQVLMYERRLQLIEEGAAAEEKTAQKLGIIQKLQKEINDLEDQRAAVTKEDGGEKEIFKLNKEIDAKQKELDRLLGRVEKARKQAAEVKRVDRVDTLDGVNETALVTSERLARRRIELERELTKELANQNLQRVEALRSEIAGLERLLEVEVKITVPTGVQEQIYGELFKNAVDPEFQKKFLPDIRFVDALLGNIETLYAENEQIISGALTFIARKQEEVSERRLQAIDRETDRVRTSVDTQRELARQGLDNSLKFEEERQDKLEQMRAEEERRARRRAERMAALQAILQVLGTGGSAKDLLGSALSSGGSIGTFREGGMVDTPTAYRAGIGGQIQRGIFTGRSHESGGIVIEAEGGEGILSKKEISALGGREGFYRLKETLNGGGPPEGMHRAATAQLIPITTPVPDTEKQALLEELKALRSELAGIEITNWSEDALRNLVERIVKGNSVRTITHKKW